MGIGQRTFNRIYLGELSPAAMARIMGVIREEYRSDSLSWYTVEEARVGRNDHPRNPGHHWQEIETDNEEVQRS
jgi:hypothetical protein